MARKETFAQAADRLLEEVPRAFPRDYEAVRYNMGRFLKYPYLVYDRDHKLLFKAQSVHDEADYSLWIDMRGMSAEEFDAVVRRHFK